MKITPEVALKNKDLAEEEMCCWRICISPECRYKHKQFLHKDTRIWKHAHFLTLVDRWGPPIGKKPEGWKPKSFSAMPAVA